MPNGAGRQPDGAHERPIHAVDFDATKLGTWDSNLLSFLLQATSYCEAHDLELRDGNLPEEIGRLLGLAQAAPEGEIDPEPLRSGPRIGSGIVWSFRISPDLVPMADSGPSPAPLAFI